MTSSLETPKPQEDWFDNVENLRPLRGGRRAGTLNEIASGLIKVSSEEAEQKFRHDFECANKHEDPLSVMWNFVVWFEEHFPTGKQRIFYPMLYKICTTYCIIERYRNDERMLKLWLKLAESFPESALAVMEFAYTKGSCRELAKFYIRWSEMYQTIGYLHRALEKLQLGVAMFAAPLPLLHDAIDSVKAQLDMNASIEDDMDDSVHQDLENCRETLGRLRGLGRQHAAPIIRTTQGPPGRIMQSTKKCRPAFDFSATAPFEVFVDESPAFSITSQKLASNTPMVRRRLVDDLADDPDYQALFGFFDDREKRDLQFSMTENACKPAQKSLVSTAKTTRRGLRNFGIRLPALDFEVFADDTDDQSNGHCIKEENEEREELTRDAPPAKKKVAAAPKKARLCMKKRLIEEMSVEEAYAKRLAASPIEL